MYEAFYGLTEKPFNLTPDPRFLFLSEKHKEAFAHLLYGIKNRTGFIMVSGEVGTGKTTICRSLLNKLDPDIEVAFIFNPFLSPEELLRKINEDFGILSQARTVKELIDELNEYLMDRNAQGKNCVLVIDEAQDLSPTVLEQIRLLSNLETETQKLLQIVLIGQPELARNLQLPELRQLNQRITARYHLRSLDEKETLQYIAYRLSTAGGRGQVRFTRGAIRAVYQASGGTPRVINAVCDRALLIGYTKELRDITTGLVREAAREIRGATFKKPVELRPLMWKYAAPSGAVVVTAAVVMLLAKLIAPFEPSPAPVLPVAQARVESVAESEDTPVKPIELVEEAKPASSPVPVPVPNLEPEPEPKLEPEPDSEPVSEPFSAPEPNPEPPKRVAIEKINTQGETPKTDLSRRLRETNAAESRNAALAAILAAWNMAVVAGYPDGDDPATLAQFGQSSGFSCEVLTPALDQLTAIGLPALARMKAGDETRWAALTAIENGKFRITADGGGAMDVSRDSFLECYANEAVIFWRDSKPAAPVLRWPMSGPDVAELKRNLRALSRLNGPASGAYDEQTARAVARLQAETGLAVDGIAGKQVRMVISSWMPSGPTPSLKKKEKARPIESPLVAIAGEPRKSQEDSPAREKEAAANEPPIMLRPGFNALPDLPFGPSPLDDVPVPVLPFLPEEGAAARENAAVIVEELAPWTGARNGARLPQMPRLPGAGGSASAAVKQSVRAEKADSHEFHS